MFLNLCYGQIGMQSFFLMCSIGNYQDSVQATIAPVESSNRLSKLMFKFVKTTVMCLRYCISLSVYLMIWNLVNGKEIEELNLRKNTLNHNFYS